MTSNIDVFEQLDQYRVIPVIAIDSVNSALPLADALLKGGLPLAEITFRTASAAEVIAVLTEKRPELLVGAGTVLTAQAVGDAVEAGASFAVAPGTNPNVIREAQCRDLPFVPGIATASEIELALSTGSTLLKFFPAELFGGVAMLKALAAPYEHTGVRFMPTGGVNLDNVEEYLALSYVSVVGGTWLATKRDIAERRWDDIAVKCRQVARLLRNRM
jgi:2-dehydro-3-deoxyphosphogluconate aldolase/(4S)-4-hydroxy-2-oxoglutarate aldolase